MSVDRFGNSHAPNLSYARGEILRSTEDDFRKLQRAWSLIRERGPGSTYVFTGLEHSLPLSAEELEFADDKIAPALSFERLKELALDHLGGSPETDDVAVFNRLTGATMATHLTLVKPGEVVIGVSATHSHPSVVRAAGHVGAQFIDTAGLGAFRDAIATERSVALVVLTRLAVTYDLLPECHSGGENSWKFRKPQRLVRRVRRDRYRRPRGARSRLVNFVDQILPIELSRRALLRVAAKGALAGTSLFPHHQVIDRAPTFV
jgi:hypothetical protein